MKDRHIRQEWYIERDTWKAYEPGTDGVDEEECIHVREYKDGDLAEEQSFIVMVKRMRKTLENVINDFDPEEEFGPPCGRKMMEEIKLTLAFIQRLDNDNDHSS